MVRLVRSRQAAREKALKRAEERRKRRPLRMVQRTTDGRIARTDEAHAVKEKDEEEEEEEEENILEVHVPRVVTKEQGGLSGENFSQLACEVLKFLLYMRGQLPDMYDTMVQSSLETQSTKSNLKFARFHSKVEKILQCLSQPHLFVPDSPSIEAGAESKVTKGGKTFFVCEVLYLFGSSVRRPVEAFLVRSQETFQNRPTSLTACDLRKSGFLAKVNRKLVTAIMAMEGKEDDAPRVRRTIRNKSNRGSRKKRAQQLPKNCKAHVLVRMIKRSGDSEGNQNAIKPLVEKKGFFAQVGVNIKRMKPIVLELSNNKGELSGEEPPYDEAALERMSQWYQCSTCVRGIR